MQRNQSGFTLIEIAIVLVIIGLLLGGVLKGQELINSAKVKNLATDFKNIPVFIYGYQDKFRSLPGDDPRADTNVNGEKNTTTSGNGIIDGLWKPAAKTDETALFWQHVRLANLAAGSTVVSLAVGNTYIPVNAVGGTIGITSAAASPILMKGSYIVCSDAIAGKFARQLDTTLDDGVTNTGSVQVVAAGTVAVATVANTLVLTPADDDKSYLVCMGF